MPALGKGGKVYAKANTTKKSKSDSKGWFKWEREGRGRKKVYTKLFKTRQPGIEKANVRPRKKSFKEAFEGARGGGADKFTFVGKSYLTKTPSELKKKSLRERLTGYKSQAEYEAARTKRIKEKRIAKMEKRKEEGKGYSAKNLAELKGSEKPALTAAIRENEKRKKSGYITKKKKPSYSVSS